jgi:hypothetical protein
MWKARHPHLVEDPSQVWAAGREQGELDFERRTRRLAALLPDLLDLLEQLEHMAQKEPAEVMRLSAQFVELPRLIRELVALYRSDEVDAELERELAEASKYWRSGD